MQRYSRPRQLMLIALAAAILASGLASALLIWQARSSSTREVLDTGAVRGMATGVLGNTAAIAEEWVAPDLPANPKSLSIQQQESLALLSGEADRATELAGEVRELSADQEAAPLQDLVDELASLSRAQDLLERSLARIGAIPASPSCRKVAAPAKDENSFAP